MIDYIIRRIISATVFAIVGIVSISIARATAHAIANKLERNMSVKILKDMSSMSVPEREEYIKRNLTIKVQRIKFGKYYLYFSENLFKVYSFEVVAHKKDIIKELGIDMTNFASDMISDYVKRFDPESEMEKQVYEKGKFETEDIANVFASLGNSLSDSGVRMLPKINIDKVYQEHWKSLTTPKSKYSYLFEKT